MRSTTWLTVVVSLVLSAGVAAFLLSTPDQGSRVQLRDLGFRSLSTDAIDAGIGHAADYHAQRHGREVATRAATASSRAWLASLSEPAVTDDRPASRTTARPATAAPAAIAAPITAQEQRNVGALVRWSDGLPATSWSVTMRDAELLSWDGGDAPMSFRVSAFVDVQVAQAATRTRRQRIPVSMRVIGTGASPGAAPTAWRIRDARPGGPATFLRAYADPVVIHRAAVDVVAPAANRDVAIRIADVAQVALPAMRDRYAALGGPSTTTIWLLEDASAAAKVLGRPAPASTVDVGRQTPHGFSWLDDRGEVAIDLSRAAQVTAPERDAAVRRELALLSLRSLAKLAPPVLREGVAGYEARRAEGVAATDFADLAAAFAADDVDLGVLLAAPATRPLSATGASGELRLAYLAGEATAAWIEEEFDHERLVTLLAQLRRGTSIDAAVRDVLKLRIAGVQRGVDAWTVGQAPTEQAPPTSGGDDEDDDGSQEDTTP